MDNAGSSGLAAAFEPLSSAGGERQEFLEPIYPGGGPGAAEGPQANPTLAALLPNPSVLPNPSSSRKTRG